mgnify:CR=1 FL=1
MNAFAIPSSVEAIDPRCWESFAPYFADLQERPLTSENLRQWLTDWSNLTRLLFEAASLIYIEKSLDTADEDKEHRAALGEKMIEREDLSVDVGQPKIRKRRTDG